MLPKTLSACLRDSLLSIEEVCRLTAVFSELEEIYYVDREENEIQKKRQYQSSAECKYLYIILLQLDQLLDRDQIITILEKSGL